MQQQQSPCPSSIVDFGDAKDRFASHSRFNHLQSFGVFYIYIYIDSMFFIYFFDSILIFFSLESRVLFDDYGAACVKASQLASATLQTVDAGIYDVNAFIADTTQFELISFYGAAYRQGSISVSSIVFGLVASDNSVHRSLELAASPVSTTTNNNNDDDNNDNEEDNEDDGDRLPPLRLVVDLRRLRQWFQTMQWPSNVAVRLFFVRSFVRD